MWNFRRGVMAAMLSAGYRVTVVAPEDESAPKNQGARVVILSILICRRKGKSR